MFVQPWTPPDADTTRHCGPSSGFGQYGSAENFCRWSVVSASWVTVLLGFGLLIRRWTGAFHRPLPSGALLLCGLALVAVAWSLRSALVRVCAEDRPPWQYPSWWLPGLALLAVGLAVSLPGTSGLGFFWMLLVAEEVASLWAGVFHGSREDATASGSPATQTPNTRPPTPSRLPDRNRGAALADRDVPQESERRRRRTPHVTLDDIDQGNIGADVWQHLTRLREPSGQETLVGLLRGEVLAGQRTLPLHVAFCPPFAAVPEVYVQQLEGPDAELHVAEVMTYGVRIDVRFDRRCEIPQQVLIQLMVGAAE